MSHFERAIARLERCRLIYCYLPFSIALPCATLSGYLLSRVISNGLILGCCALIVFFVSVLLIDRALWRIFPGRVDHVILSSAVRVHGPDLLDRILEDVRVLRPTLRYVNHVQFDLPNQSELPELMIPHILWALDSKLYDDKERGVLKYMLMFINRIGHKVGEEVVFAGHHACGFNYYAISRKDVMFFGL